MQDPKRLRGNEAMREKLFAGLERMQRGRVRMMQYFAERKDCEGVRLMAEVIERGKELSAELRAQLAAHPEWKRSDVSRYLASKLPRVHVSDETH